MIRVLSQQLIKTETQYWGPTLADDINWQSLVFQSGWLQKLDKLANKRFGEGGLAEEAGTYVLEKLSADQWQCLLSFKGNCKPESYLHTVTSHLLEEFSRQRFGRLRPPEWLKRQGTLWLQVWKMLCLERQLIQSIVEHCCLNNLREHSVIHEAIRTIKARLPWCGGDAHREIATSNNTDESDYDPTAHIATNETPEQPVTEAHYTETLLLISSLMNEKPIETMFGKTATELCSNYVNKNQQKFDALRQKLLLTDEEKIIMRMHFQDGIKKSVIAKSLGMKDYLPGRILKELLAKISVVFEELEIDLREINDICVEISE